MSAFARIAIMIGTAMLCGCVNISQPNPQKGAFSIAVMPGAAKHSSPARAGEVLRVARVRIAPPADGRMFVYRRGEHEFELDYFNVFVADPERLLTAGVVQVLSREQVFATVLEPTGTADATVRLETNVTSMYGDLRDISRPSVHLAARFVLLDDRGGQTRVIGDWMIERDEPASSAAPADLAAAWGRAWTGVLVELAEHLRADGSV